MVGHLPAGDLWPDQGQKVNSQNFDSKYLEKSDRYEVGTQGALDPRTHGLSIGTVRSVSYTHLTLPTNREV